MRRQTSFGLIGGGIIFACILLGIYIGIIGPALVLSLVTVVVAGTTFLRSRNSSIGDHSSRSVDHSPPRLLTLSDPWVRRTLVAAIALRVVLAIVLNLTGADKSLAPDSWGYEVYGKYIAMSWEDPRIDPSVVRGYKPLSAFQHLNALVTYLTGFDSAPIVSILNAFVGALSAWLTAVVAGRIYGPVAQRRTFLLAAFFPSLVLWSSVNLRDCWNWLVVAMSLLAAINLRERFSLKDLLLVGACVAFLPMIRSYMLLLVGTGVILSFLVVRIRSLPVSLTAFAVVIGVMLMIGEQFNMHLLVDVDDRLELMNRMKWGMSGGNAGYYRGVDISTPEGALRYLPTGVSIFLFAPFPWTPTNLRQAVAVPETLVWYVIFFQAARHMWRTRKTTILSAAPVFFTTMVMLLAYGLVEGNEGTAFRHRSQVMLLFFVFAGGDLSYRLGRRFAERRLPSTPPASSLVTRETVR